MADTFKPGEIVTVSGIYSLILEGGDNEGRTFDSTCVEGDRFPPTRTGVGVHYELKYGAPYSHRHPDVAKGTARVRAQPQCACVDVQHDLFDGNPDGWKVYVAHMQKKVKWFGDWLPKIKGDASTELTLDAAQEAIPVEASAKAAPAAEWDAPDEKKGWPRPQPGSTS